MDRFGVKFMFSISAVLILLFLKKLSSAVLSSFQLVQYVITKKFCQKNGPFPL